VQLPFFHALLLTSIRYIAHYYGLWDIAGVDDILAGFYVKDDGRVNPVDATMALAKGMPVYMNLSFSLTHVRYPVHIRLC
jgi:hypothetical protein